MAAPSEKSLRKGIRLLEILAFSPDARTVSDLAQEADLKASNVHRLLAVLSELGFVRQEGRRGGYTATPRLYELGTAVGDRIDLRHLLAPHLRALNQETNEAVGISVWRDGGTTLISRLESAHPIRTYTRLGSRIPTHHTSAGLILLAHRTAQEVTDYFAANIPFGEDRDATIAELTELLTEVRRTDVARVHGAWMAGLFGIAVPLRKGGEVVAAVNVSGPSERFDAAAMDAFLIPLKRSAREMERTLSGGL